MKQAEKDPIDLAWGVNEIGEIIGRTPRQTYHLCRIGGLPVRKIGGQWVAERGALKRFFEEVAA